MKVCDRCGKTDPTVRIRVGCDECGPTPLCDPCEEVHRGEVEYEKMIDKMRQDGDLI